MGAQPAGLHVGVIMDGNGRWAQARGRPRSAGHAAGAEAVRRTVEAAPKLGIGTLTLYAFSSDNWRRPPEEVTSLMRLFQRFLMAEAGRCAEHGVAIQVIGRRDRLSSRLRRVIEAAEAATATAGEEGPRPGPHARRERRLRLRIAVDYSSRDAILRAACRLAGISCEALSPDAGPGAGEPAAQASVAGRPMPWREVEEELGAPGLLPAMAPPSRSEFSRLLADPPHDAEAVPDVDLLIRSGGERRLSDFLLWECAYAELFFSDCMWPDFAARDLEEAVAEFHRRERRFGLIPPCAEEREATPRITARAS